MGLCGGRSLSSLTISSTERIEEDPQPGTSSRPPKRSAAEVLGQYRDTREMGYNGPQDDEMTGVRPEPSGKFAKNNGMSEVTNNMKGMFRRASHSMKPGRPYSSRSRKDSPAATGDSSSPTRHGPDSRKAHSLFSQFRRRRDAVAGPSGTEGRWNPAPAPIPASLLAPPVAIPLHPSSGSAARASAAAAAQNTRIGRSSSNPRDSGSDYSRVTILKDSESAIYMDSQTSLFTESSTLVDINVPLIQQDPVEVLPTELAVQIFSYLDGKSLSCAESVSRSWSEIASSNAAWREVFTRRYKQRAHVSPPPIQMGGLGFGDVDPSRNWKKAYRARKTIERRWNSSNPAAFYFQGHTDSVYCCQFDEEKIITGSRDRTIRIWDMNTHECLKVIGGPGARPVADTPPPLATHPSATFGNLPSVNGTSRGNEIYHIPSDYHEASILCLQYDDKIMVTGSSDYTCIVWDMKTFEPITRLRHHTAGVLDVCLDEKYIISCSKDATICVWDRYTFKLLHLLHGHKGPVNAVQLRGNLLVSASGDGVAKLWNLDSFTCVKEFASKDRGLAAVEFSDDAKFVLAGGNDMVVYQFDASSGELTHTYNGHSGLVRSLFLDTPNNIVLSGSYDQSIRIYNYATGRTIANYENWTTSWILSAKCDYRRIVCTSQDGRALLLDFGHGVANVEHLTPSVEGN